MKVKVTNLTWGEMEISGVHVGCYCIESISPDLPFTVGPHDAATLEIFVNPPKPRSGDAHFHETVVFFINGGREFLTIDMSGRVVTDRLEN